jgi:hypothetical protein
VIRKLPEDDEVEDDVTEDAASRYELAGTVFS